MEQRIFVENQVEFNDLWTRATAGTRSIKGTPTSDLVYFDSSIVTSHHYYRFVRDLLRFTDSSDDAFAFVGLRPDPFNYFFHHFSKYPAIVFQPAHSEADYCRLLQSDPGGSPADALAYNTRGYVVLPISGGWITYGDESSEIAIFSSTPDVVEFARKRLARDLLRPDPNFRIID
ncbi:hypothetical protein bAD24_III05455 [Burkholderia sp. AD24]|nr:hypothetical protein bAD24_III05455 [Burkholderia sp. AD24]